MFYKKLDSKQRKEGEQPPGDTWFKNKINSNQLVEMGSLV